MKTTFIYIILFLISIDAIAQRDYINLEGANVLESGKHNGQKVTWLKGNVRFSHKDTKLRCDSAFQYEKQNLIYAYGRIRILKADSIQLTGDTLYYNGDSSRAIINGNVRLVDPSMTLLSDRLDYKVDQQEVSYTTGGKIFHHNNTLTSKEGYYFLNSKKYFFKDSVRLIGDSTNLETDSLQYQLDSNKVVFTGPTEMQNGKTYLYAHHGYYLTEQREAFFKDSAYVEDDKFILQGDSLYYNAVNDSGYAIDRVRIVSKKDSVTICGNRGSRKGRLFENKVFGDAILFKNQGKDTLWLKADTIISVNDTIETNSYIKAYKHVSFLLDSNSGKSDSLFFSFKDSTLRLIQDPILFGQKDQLKSDTILVYLKDKKVDKAQCINRAFVINKDSLNHSNQVKGRKIDAFFTNGKLDRTIVNGNGECVYFALDESNKLIGMNRIICSNLNILFVKSKLTSISFEAQPDAQFHPPHMINQQNAFLQGYDPRFDEREFSSAYKKLLIPFFITPGKIIEEEKQ